MAFCINCGQPVSDGANFCANCGTPVSGAHSSTKRKTSYAGEIYKCPNCGEGLRSFLAKCPSCGHEIRGGSTSATVQAFADKLASAKTRREKVAIIRNFPIQNTKEDIFEFMILAATNIGNDLESDISAAWQSKTEQAYQKAQIVFHGEEELDWIQSIYSKVCTKLSKQKKIEKTKKARKLLVELMPILPNVIIISGWLISIFVLIPLCNIDLDIAGTNSYQLLLMLDFVAGAALIPFAFRCASSLPKLIASLGLILSVVVLIPLCGKNLDVAGTNAYQLILIVDIVCSVIILRKMFRQNNTDKTEKK